MKSKQISMGKGTQVRGGPGGMLREQRTGPQKPGVTSVAKGASNKMFKAQPGPGNQGKKQSVVPAKAGQTGKGGGSGAQMPAKGKRGYGGDANGNPY